MSKNVPKGIYTIAISVLNPAGNQPSLRFDNENYFNGGRCPMGYVGMEVTPLSFEIDPEKFDDLRADYTLH